MPQRSDRTTVHPHARGENAPNLYLVGYGNGSPPRAWGKPRLPRAGQGAIRFTPTRVGKTRPCYTQRRAWAVHPHARGENRFVAGIQTAIVGSPPRAWGKRVTWQGPLRLRRFTPTRVGKTHCQRRGSRERPVHPHARGENFFFRFLSPQKIGSPPRAWGKRLGVHIRADPGRFTPTRVGKTPASTGFTRVPTVHPHARGENVRPEPRAIRSTGSPPRAWGKRQRLGERPRELRFTPTRVGKTLILGNRTRWRSVHPHARGENTLGALRVYVSSGSPPRAWGKRRSPRSASAATGSPPRAWGKLG